MVRPSRGRRRAHPRACGENSRARSHARRNVGSSPRVRGKLPYRARGRGDLRLIPARAGKTGNIMARKLPEGAHPRACGENRLPPSSLGRIPGSSPRVRGKPSGVESASTAGGLIPARAGKTMMWAAMVVQPRAHPRACGENLWAPLDSAPSTGSSPRVRGKRWRRPWGPRIRGLIPARAGKTMRTQPPPPPRWAHPRACGENHARAAAWPAWRGSSPRVRGKRPGGGVGTVGPRLIPARAGKTLTSPSPWYAPQAHPRACGENTEPSPRDRRPRGSSPRVRGKLGVADPLRVRPRLIPARAGKTARRGSHPMKV